MRGGSARHFCKNGVANPLIKIFSFFKIFQKIVHVCARSAIICAMCKKKKQKSYLFQNIIQIIFNQSPKEIYDLFNSSLVVVDMPTIQDGCQNTCLEFSKSWWKNMAG